MSITKYYYTLLTFDNIVPQYNSDIVGRCCQFVDGRNNEGVSQAELIGAQNWTGPSSKRFGCGTHSTLRRWFLFWLPVDGVRQQCVFEVIFFSVPESAGF